MNNHVETKIEGTVSEKESVTLSVFLSASIIGLCLVIGPAFIILAMLEKSIVDTVIGVGLTATGVIGSALFFIGNAIQKHGAEK